MISRRSGKGQTSFLFSIAIIYCLSAIACKATKQTLVPNASPSNTNSSSLTSGTLGISRPSVKRSGKSLSLSRGSVKKKDRTKKGFSVYIFPRKRKDPELSLFPAGVSNKFRISSYDRHTSQKKANRLLKKEEKKNAKKKQEE